MSGVVGVVGETFVGSVVGLAREAIWTVAATGTCKVCNESVEVSTNDGHSEDCWEGTSPDVILYILKESTRGLKLAAVLVERTVQEDWVEWSLRNYVHLDSNLLYAFCVAIDFCIFFLFSDSQSWRE